MQAWNNSAAFKMKQNLQLKRSSSRNKHQPNFAALSALLSVVQTQSTHWQTGTQLKYGRKIFFHANYAALFSEGCNVSFFVKKFLFVNQGEMFLAFVCIQETSVCVCCWNALFLWNTEVLQSRLLRVCQVLCHKE